MFLLLFLGLVVLFVLVLFYFVYQSRSKIRELPSKVKSQGPWKGKFLKGGFDEVCDVLVVGAGPAGATFSYFLKKANPQLRVNMADRCSFPRKKYCGDAWCAPALDILDEMGILKDVETGETDLPVRQDFVPGKPLCHPVERGGFISPAGFSCIGGPYGSQKNIRTYAIKRFVMDEFIARHAAEEGVELMEGCEVESMIFDEKEGFWAVQANGDHLINARVLVLADGSNSYLARKLGVVTTPPDSVCSHQYIRIAERHRKKFDADGVMFFSRSLLPGYSAILKHYDGELYLGTYILPGGYGTSAWIKPFEEKLFESYEYIKNAFGISKRHPPSELDFRETTKVAPIRTGGESKTYGDHLLIIGDAAGQVDPLTGEGIHTAMIGGKIAAQVTSEMFESGDFSADSTAVYQRRWMEEFGDDFWWSSMMAKTLVKFPMALDAMAVVGARKGQAFLDEFGEMMTGVKSKRGFLKPHLAIPLAFELLNQVFQQKILKKQPTVPDCGQEMAEKAERKRRKKKEK
mmetsp:Transcript_14534/g.20217  ORF Transcript_14534/g.20217 Transcript_14534/m.20217 type:complete len:518 (+) Transcript_14534:114-1667(+)